MASIAIKNHSYEHRAATQKGLCHMNTFCQKYSYKKRMAGKDIKITVVTKD